MFLSSPLLVLATFGAAVGRSNDELFLSFLVHSMYGVGGSLLPASLLVHPSTDVPTRTPTANHITLSIPISRDWAVHMPRQEGTSMTKHTFKILDEKIASSARDWAIRESCAEVST